MTHGSLFSGIGGFDLAAEWAGWANIFQVEWNTYCQKILKKNFPDARIYSDIRDFDGTPWRGSVDVISGGFPCQPYSSAGKRLGKEDDRHLWPEMLRVIREATPRWVVGENVRGLVNWSGGLVFDEVQADLEAAGYEVQAFLLPAASVNAPHRRERIWFVAYRSGEQVGAAGQSREHGGVESTIADAKFFGGLQSGCEHKAEQSHKNGKARPDSNPKSQQVGAGFRQNEPGKIGGRRFGDMGGEVDTNANNQRREEQHAAEKPGRPGRPGGGMLAQWDEWTTEPPVCGVDDGVPRRMDRIAALGNAVVPQLVWRIFETINQYENGHKA